MDVMDQRTHIVGGKTASIQRLRACLSISIAYIDVYKSVGVTCPLRVWLPQYVGVVTAANTGHDFFTAHACCQSTT